MVDERVTRKSTRETNGIDHGKRDRAARLDGRPKLVRFILHTGSAAIMANSFYWLNNLAMQKHVEAQVS